MVTETKQSPQLALQELNRQDELIFRWVQICKVTDPTSQRNAENMLIGARSAYKRADTKRRELLKPIEQTITGINDLFKPYLDKLKGAIDLLDGSLKQYQADCLELAREEQHRQLIAQAEVIAQAQITGEVYSVPLVDQTTPSPSKTNHADMGTVTYREDMDVQIVDPSLVPRDLCEPSLTKIRARVKSGVVDIPGVLITKKLVTVARRLT